MKIQVLGKTKEDSYTLPKEAVILLIKYQLSSTPSP